MASTGYAAGPEPAPGFETRWLGRAVVLCTDRLSPNAKAVSPGRRPFLPGPLTLSFPFTIALQWAEKTETALIKKKVSQYEKS